MEPRRDAEVIPIRDRLVHEGEPVAVQRYEQSFEVELDDEPPEPTRQPMYVDAVERPAEERPVIPPWMRSLPAAKAMGRLIVARAARRAGYHAARAPFWYIPLAVFWSIVGVGKLLGRQIVWWWQPHLVRMENEAANANDSLGFHKHRKEAKATRLFRFYVLLAELLGLAAVVVLLYAVAPWWVTVPLLAVVVPTLAHFGRPPGKPIVKSAIVAPRYRKLNSDIVMNAYYVAQLGNPDKPGHEITFGSRMTEDAQHSGCQVVVNLGPASGKSWADMLKPGVKSTLASAMDVLEQQIFLTKDKRSTRSHTLFVAYEDPLARPARPTPLLDCKPRNIWQPAPFGVDERRRKVALSLMWISVLIGAQPRKGKTFAARLLALFAALDPYVRIYLADGKSSPDWRSFALVAHRMVFGTAPTAKDPDPVGRFIDMLREIKKHIQRVNEVLSTLPPEQCPEGKLTEELARDPRYPELYVLVLILEEFQVYFELEDQEQNKEVAGLLSNIQAVGPSAGVIVLSSSQKPSGVGAGDVARLFNRFRDNHQVRFALKCGNRLVSEAVLGGDAYGEGYDASALPTGDGSDGGPDYRGIGILYGATDQTPTVRVDRNNKLDTEKILLAARKHRERLGTLSGEAAGDVVFEGEVIDPLTDALSVIAGTETNISWPRLAARLAENLPDRYADIDAASISARLRGLGARGKNVADREFFPSGRGQGVARADLEALAAKRALGR